MPPQKEQHEKKQRIATKMGSERYKIARLISFQEDLRTGCISCRPTYEIRSYDDSFFGLARDIPRYESKGEGGGGPEGEGYVVGD